MLQHSINPPQIVGSAPKRRRIIDDRAEHAEHHVAAGLDRWKALSLHHEAQLRSFALPTARARV